MLKKQTTLVIVLCIHQGLTSFLTARVTREALEWGLEGVAIKQGCAKIFISSLSEVGLKRYDSACNTEITKLLDDALLRASCPALKKKPLISNGRRLFFV